MAKSQPNPSAGMLWFFILTTIYSVMAYNGGKLYGDDNAATTVKTYFFAYVLFVIVGEYFINLNITNDLCGSSQWQTALMTTLFPWGFIFGVLVLLLTMFRGWLSPFSNTIGYGVALMAGLSNTMADIIEPDPKNSANEDPTIKEALAHIYSDQSLMINEITTGNFDYFWENMQALFQKKVATNMQLKQDLYSLVYLKEVVSEYVWYMLAGLLITSVSFNYISNSACGMSVSEMQKRHDDYEDQLKKAQEQAKDKNAKQRVYSTQE